MLFKIGLECDKRLHQSLKAAASCLHCPALAGLVRVGISLSTLRDVPVVRVTCRDSQASFRSFTGVPHLLEELKSSCALDKS